MCVLTLNGIRDYVSSIDGINSQYNVYCDISSGCFSVNFRIFYVLI